MTTRVRFTRRMANPTRSAQPGQIVDLPDDEAAARIQAGHCVAVDQPKTGLLGRLAGRRKQDPASSGSGGDKPLEKMTVDQLKAYADDRDISLPEGGKKADLIAAITAAETPAE